MANAPRGMFPLRGPNGRGANTSPDGRAIGAFDQGTIIPQQVINRAEMVTSLPAPLQAADDASRALAVASNTATHEASQAQFESAAGTLANLMNSPAQQCCLKHRVRAFPEAYQSGGPVYGLGALLSS